MNFCCSLCQFLLRLPIEASEETIIIPKRQEALKPSVGAVEKTKLTQSDETEVCEIFSCELIDLTRNQIEKIVAV